MTSDTTAAVGQYYDEVLEEYDEFATLKDQALNAGLEWGEIQKVRRRSVEFADGQRLSMLVWGDGVPEVVCVHGRGQNAHAWDVFAMMFNRPMIALDLPGHGHSSWRDDHDYGPFAGAEMLSRFFADYLEAPVYLVGMSAGGLTSIRVAVEHSSMIKGFTLVDMTPGTHGRAIRAKTYEQGPVTLIDGRQEFESLEDLTNEVSSALSRELTDSIRVGIRHNAKQRPDGAWVWRYDQARHEGFWDPETMVPLWDDLASLTMPTLLVKAGKSSLVHPEDQERFLATAPRSSATTIEGASHSVQSSKPKELVDLITAAMDDLDDAS